MDGREVLFVRLDEVQGDSIAIHLQESLLEDMRVEADGLMYSPVEAPGKVVKVVPFQSVPVAVSGHILKAAVPAGGFIIAYGEPGSVDGVIEGFRRDAERELEERYNRINGLLTENNPVRSNLEGLDKALAWLLVTTDELVTEQQGKGIYAGLPWFNEYWGRDMFISMPGTCLVTGQFEMAKGIFSDFSRLQDTDPASITLGRIPNRANLEEILYNTTDGTPRFVIQIEEYVRYSGDTAYIREIYPVVKLSIEASIRNYMDENGYLLHADADTWMDVKRKGVPGSPRGNRANDIQALWYEQLQAGKSMAEFMKDTEYAVKWDKLAERLKKNFEKDYADKVNVNIIDHLNEDNTPDGQFRPNQLYTYELISDETLKMQVTRKVWEELVYPWGTASLSQYDEDFHPQHENWHYYHKDDAYHNGTVWLWNNGHAMQRMIEMNQPDIAWELFKNMNRQALVEGAVGSLSENADAHPREGATWAGRSGTFLQAWSNAEQLRVWYQYFLGVLPEMDSPSYPGLVNVTPKLPSEITSLYWKQRVGKGSIESNYKDNGHSATYTYRLNGQEGFIRLSIGQFPEVLVQVEADGCVTAVVKGERLSVKVLSASGKTTHKIKREVSPELEALKEEQDRFFEGTSFATPVKRENLKAFKTYYEKPLTYRD